MKKWLLTGLAMLAIVHSGLALEEKEEKKMREFRFGEWTLTALQDASSTMRRELFPALPEKEFVRLAGGRQAPASVNVFLLKRGDGQTVLVDAGYGSGRGSMEKELKRAGIAPEKISAVLLTHMHGDHIGGLIDSEGKAFFPAAKLYVSAPEQEYWQNNAPASAGGDRARTVLKAYDGRVITFCFGEEPLPGIRALDASGHTPGHTVYESDSFLILGDLLHAAAVQFARPEISATYDMDPEKAVSARRRFYDLSERSAKPVAGMHLPFPGVGKITRSRTDGYVYTPYMNP